MNVNSATVSAMRDDLAKASYTELNWSRFILPSSIDLILNSTYAPNTDFYRRRFDLSVQSGSRPNHRPYDDG